VISFTVSECPRPARGSETGANAEHECRRKRYKWQKYGRTSHYGSHSSRHDGGHRGVNGVYEPEPATDEIAGEEEANDACSDSDNDLQHIEFRV
jgi:hypothetical protein